MQQLRCIQGGMLPFGAMEPAHACAAMHAFQQAVGEAVRVPGPPVLWLAPRCAGLRPDAGGVGARKAPPPPAHAPLWWAGGGWREVPMVAGAVHALGHPAYVPKRFAPHWSGGALVRPVPAPREPGPLQGVHPSGGSGVLRALRILLSDEGGNLWVRPSVGGEWCRYPFATDFQLGRIEAFEICEGDRYVLLLRGAKPGPDAVVTYDLRRNSFRSPCGPTRALPGGHAGQAPVPWRPVAGATVADAVGAPLHAWVLEATANYLLLLAPTSRDGVQRRSGDDSPHSAVHFIGHAGEVVSHHLPCNALRLTVQRYDDHLLFVKDQAEHPEDACMDDDWHPSYPRVAAWLLCAEDTAVPPVPVHLPGKEQGWGAADERPWSLVLARGNLTEIAPSHRLSQDTAPRLYLLEEGSPEQPTLLRLWATRRVDDATNILYQRHTLDGEQLVRHALAFSPLFESEIDMLDFPEPGALRDGGASGAWLVWSPDIRHAARIIGGRFAFWRCALAFAGESAELVASKHRAYVAAVSHASEVSPAEVLPLGKWGWEGMHLPADCASNGVVTGLPCFPALRRAEGTYQRPEDWWIHPVGGDAAQHASLSVYR